MFNVKKEHGPYFADVQYEPSGMQKMHFDVQFKFLKESEIKGIRAKYQAEEFTDEDICRDVVVGWRKVSDAEGQELPFNPELFAAMLDTWPGLSFAIAATWFKAVRFGAKKI